MSQSPGLPVGFHPRWKLRTGLAVLENGLPELPNELDYQMSIWSHDPIADLHGVRDLGGRAIVEGGGSFTDSPVPGHPAAVVVGRVRPDVTHLALLQDGHGERRALRSYFGAWVVCTERWSPYQINAFGEDSAVLASLHGPPRLPSRAASS